MKTISIYKYYKRYIRKNSIFPIFFILIFSITNLIAQEESEKKDTRPIRSTFESAWILNNQSVMVPLKGTF